MKAMINKTHIEGWIYEHKLVVKTTGPNSKNPGTEFISGTISIATDDECLNIVPVHYTYVTAMTSKGKADSRYTALKNVIDGVWKSVMANGKDSATKVKIDSAIGINDFYTDRTGEEVLVTAKRNEGGFIHAVDVLADDEKSRDTFECDMIITGISHIDANEERNLPEKIVLKGCVFDFSKTLLPVEFSAVNPSAIAFFEGLDISPKNPAFRKVWGRQISEVSTRTIEEESAFGDSKVREVQSTRKDWVITGTSKDEYAWDAEDTITVAELNECMAKRETHLAEVKQNWENYKSSQGGAATSSTPVGGFNF